MDAPTPNTSAFLSYLSENFGNGADVLKESNPSTLPPAALFPMPGRDTPEDTPPSSVNTSQSPEKPFREIISGDSEDDAPARNRRQSTTNHKRKAGQGHQVNDDEAEDEDDSASDFATGHDDKRQHQNAKQNAATGRKPAARKSGGGGGDETVPKGKESKAARRKEQNRAAQKAFRERREAKVRDLEDQVRELEAKSYGTSVENENLRGILKRLQEENVALRQAAFTFSMPVNGAAPAVNGVTPATGDLQQQKTQGSKPPTPQQLPSPGDSLRSVGEIPQPFTGSNGRPMESPSDFISPPTVHRTNSTDSSSSGQIDLFSGTENAFATAAAAGRNAAPSNGNSLTVDNQALNPAVTPEQSNGQTELDALWASFLAQSPQRDPQQQQVNAQQNPFSLLNAQQAPMSFVNNNTKFGGGAQTTPNAWDKTAFRDTTNDQTQQPEVKPDAAAPSIDAWAQANTGVDEFLASLTGANNQKESSNDDDFNASIQQLLGSHSSPSAMFNVPGNMFSPTNYLNMSPSPLASSNGPSPMSLTNTTSNSATPESSVGGSSALSPDAQDAPSLVCRLPTPGDSEPIYVIDEKGKLVRPSELWTRMGMQNESNVEHLIVDDLCTMMRAKATCQDGRKVVKASDAEQMFLYKGPDDEQASRMRALEKRVGLPDGMFGPLEGR